MISNGKRNLCFKLVFQTCVITLLSICLTPKHREEKLEPIALFLKSIMVQIQSIYLHKLVKAFFCRPLLTSLAVIRQTIYLSRYLCSRALFGAWGSRWMATSAAPTAAAARRKGKVREGRRGEAAAAHTDRPTDRPNERTNDPSNRLSVVGSAWCEKEPSGGHWITTDCFTNTINTEWRLPFWNGGLRRWYCIDDNWFLKSAAGRRSERGRDRIVSARLMNAFAECVESATLIHGLQLVWRSFSRIGIEASSTAARGKEEKFSGQPVRTRNIQGDWARSEISSFIALWQLLSVSKLYSTI